MTQCIDAVNDRDEKTSASVSQLSSTQPNVEPAPTDELRHTIGESKSPNDENAVPTTSMCRRFGQSHMWLACTGVLTIL